MTGEGTLREEMLALRGLVALAAAACAAAQEPANRYAPWGTHLAFGNDPTSEMSVVWSTRLSPAAPAVT